MSVFKSDVNSPESAYCDTSENRLSQAGSPNVPQTVTNTEYYELPQQNCAPVTSTGPVAYHQANNRLTLNGVNGTAGYPPNMNVVYDRNGASIPNGIINGLRTLSIPNGINGPHVMHRHNPNGLTINGANGYITAGPNTRFVTRTNGWVTTNKPVNGVKKQKRNRTAFTSHQMMELEQEYARTRYLDRTRRIELSEILHLNERTIKIWFQNRRMKEKKDRAESLEDSEEVSTTESSPELGNVPMPMLIHEQYPTTVTNDMYNRYVEYPASTAQMAMPSSMTPGVHGPMNDYAEYMPPEVYEENCRQVHLQVQHYAPVYSNGTQELKQDATPQPDSCSVAAAPTNIPDLSWDLSWIRGIEVDDEF